MWRLKHYVGASLLSFAALLGLHSMDVPAQPTEAASLDTEKNAAADRCEEQSDEVYFVGCGSFF